MNKKGIKYNVVFISFAIFIVLVIVLVIVKVPVNEKTSLTEITPYAVVDYYTAKEKYFDGPCVTRNFSYSYSWEGWDYGNSNLTTPYLKIINHENETGTFIVQFAFFDDSKYPYDVFKNKITWEDATMYSDEVNVTLGPMEKNIVSIPTLKQNPQASYWAIGDIKVPVIVDCGEVKYKTVIKNRTITENITVEKEVVIKKNISLLKYILARFRQNT